MTRTMSTASAPSCAWCGHPLDATAGGPARVAHCARCGAGTTLPELTPAEIQAAYGDWYRPSSGRFAGGGDRLLRASRARLARRLDRIAPPGPVLDVGAGDGTLLDALAKHGREAVGLEPEPTRSDIRSDDVVEVDGTWSAVVFWHSLEHLPNAAAALAHAARLLPNGGVIVIAIPNFESLQARLFGQGWLPLDLPRHRVHIPGRALTARLEELGLEVTLVSSWRGGQVAFGWVHGLTGLLPGLPDLYDAIRKPAARQRRTNSLGRVLALVAAAALLPLALACTAVEVLTRRGGTIYVEATSR